MTPIQTIIAYLEGNTTVTKLDVAKAVLALITSLVNDIPTGVSHTGPNLMVAVPLGHNNLATVTALRALEARSNEKDPTKLKALPPIPMWLIPVLTQLLQDLVTYLL
jgi:hypothetical protein